MKNPDEIKKGLECCKEDECFGDRENCPYTADPKLCVGVMCADALALIQQLQAEIAEQAERIRQLEAERDAAVACIPRVCKYCKHDGPLNAWGESECELDSVFPNGCLNGNTGWQWRGVQKESP